MITIKYGLCRKAGERGFTLIELLVTSVIFITVLGVILGFVGSARRARDISSSVLESRQNARSSLDFIISEIRMAGTSISIPIVTSNDDEDSVILYPVTPELVDGRPEKITVVGKFEDVETTLRDQMPNPSAVLKVNSTDGFEEGDLAIVTNGSFANLFQITGVNHSSKMLQHNPSSPYNLPGGHRPWPPSGYAEGSRVFKVALITYYVDRSDSSCNYLMRQKTPDDPRVLSEFVEDFELSYELRDGTITSDPEDPLMIRKVIVTLEAASREKSKIHTTRLLSAARPRCL
ncbi:MAG: PilW family protein [bacterium]